jgi:2'-5' RNA ligase
VPEPQRDELGRFIALCARSAPDFRWTPTANLHITIRFVGSVDRRLVEEVADSLAGLALAGFELEVGEIGAFGRGRTVRVVWLGLRGGADGAGVLAAAVEAECLRAGMVGAVSAQERPFQAHLTLARARARTGSRLPDLPATPSLNPWRADHLILYSSRLTKAGAIYEGLRNFPLR